MNHSIFFYLTISSLLFILPLSAAQELEIRAACEPTSLSMTKNNLISFIHSALNQFLTADLSKIEDVSNDFVQKYIKLLDVLFKYEETLINMLTPERLKSLHDFLLQSTQNPLLQQIHQKSVSFCMQLAMKRALGNFDKRESKQEFRNTITTEDFEGMNQNSKAFVDFFANLVEEQGSVKGANNLKKLHEIVKNFENQNREKLQALVAELIVLKIDRSLEQQSQTAKNVTQIVDTVGMPRQGTEDSRIQAIANQLSQSMLKKMQQARQ